MNKTTIIAFLSCCCVFIYSQQLTFTKAFEGHKKNVAISIINNHPHYFHVLRYNKAAHDITIERRDKPNAHILAFTPLKLDSVNSSLFDYENLDYLCFENDYKLYFVFEKVLNKQRTIYLKAIDTLGKSNGFMELASLHSEEGESLNFSFSKGGDNHSILIVGTISYPNGITKKSAILFDVNSHKTLWIKKLPHENSMAELTDNFITNKNNDLVYVHYKIKSISVVDNFVKSPYGNFPLSRLMGSGPLGYINDQNPVKRTVINEYDKITLIKSFSDSKEIISRVLNLNNIEVVNWATIVPEGDDVIYAAHVVENDMGPKPYVHLERMNKNMDSVLYMKKHLLSLPVYKQLTFFDGNDYDDPSYKKYFFNQIILKNDEMVIVSERKSENYYKELLSWRFRVNSGELVKLEVIPRKVFYFSGRTRFKNIGECMITLKRDSLNFYVLEDPKNFNAPAKDFKYHSFKQQKNLWGSNIVCYHSGTSGITRKSLTYVNQNFELVPLLYKSNNESDEVFYFNEGTYEKFGFISLKYP
ncbi:MAG: hypothetical protein H0W61_12410 [Bacteroidetes bacterium]|nr:hypothetical protein [Bacteroidota bacterium]